MGIGGVATACYLWRMNRWILQIFTAYMLSLPLRGQEILQLDGRHDYSLGGYVQYYMDTAWLTPQKVFVKIKQGQGTTLPNSYFREPALNKLCWLHFRVQNDTVARRLIFRLKRHDIHHFQAFKKTKKGIDTLALTGDAYPFAQRPILVSDFCFLIALDQNEEAEILILLEKRWEELNASFSLQSERVFYYDIRQDYLLIFFYVGAIGFMLVFNLFLWINLEDKIHFYYSLNLLCNSLLVFNVFGLGYEYLWPHFTYQQSILNSILSVLLSVTNLFFVSKFLDLEANSYFFKPIRYFSRFLGLWTFLTLPTLFIKIIYYPGWLIIGYRYALLLFVAIVVLLILLVIIEQFRKKNSLVKIYALSMLFFVAGAALYVFSVIFDAPWLRSSDFVMVGNLLEVLTLTFGLTIRYNSFKQRSNDLALQLVETQNTVVKQIIRTQEAERSRLAQDLHDDLGGTLSALKGRIANESVQLETLGLIEKAINDLRIVSRNLLPIELEKEGLAQAIRYTIERLQKAIKIEFTYIVFGQEVRLPQEDELNLYRIVAELLNNVVKHADATKAVIQVVFHADYLHISVEDDGVGIKTEKKSWGIGLKNISSRVEFLKARLSIDSSPDRGTTVIVEVPYPY